MSSMIMPRQWSETSNAVFTLDGNLKIMDKLDGLAEGERIFSTRFVKDKLYMDHCYGTHCYVHSFRMYVSVRDTCRISSTLRFPEQLSTTVNIFES